MEDLLDWGDYLLFDVDEVLFIADRELINCI